MVGRKNEKSMSNPSASRGKYADLTKDQLVALLRQRDETRLGLVWERDPDLIEADRSLNDDFVALDFEEKLVRRRARVRPSSHRRGQLRRAAGIADVLAP